MKKQYPYSNDTEFLSKIDKLRVRDQWVKIVLLEYNSEVPLKNIEGKVASGTLTKNGDSAVRRTCSLSCVVDAFKYKPEEIQSDYSISKKIFLELGITNDTDDYKDEEIIWFPQGVFFITSFAISTSATGNATINLQFKDKMAQLDGTVGGILPATTRFDTVTTIINGIAHTDKTLVYDIIMELVNHFGNEDISNIIIDDIPRKAKRIVRWMGLESLWIYPITDGERIAYDVCLTSDLKTKTSAHKPPTNNNGEIIGSKEYKTNQDIGYVYEDFVYDEELTFNAGSKVTDVLDKIKSWLGNYEYFYDEYGQFHFQEIKNYLNNPQSNNIWNKIKNIDDPDYLNKIMDDSDYLYETTKGKAVYTFDDNINLISITNTPVYENIKNDFIVEGTMTVNNVKRTCRYHLVIDDKPTISTDGYDNVLIYTDPSSENVTATKPKIIAPIYSKKEKKYQWILPESGEKDKIYGLLEEPQTFTYQKVLEDMSDFDLYYTKAITSENSLIEEENSLVLKDSETNSNNINSIKDFLFAFLERYMGYPDVTPYKEKFINIVFTLARQLKRYINNDRRETSSSLTEEYFNSLYSKFNSDKVIIENQSGDQTILINKISWCGGLLKLLKELFSNFDDKDLGNNKKYINEDYWPSINSELTSLWDKRPEYIDINYPTALKNWRKSRCLEYLDILQIKQKQLNILIEQYTQIMNNYNTLISSTKRNGGDIAPIVVKRDIVQNQINNFSEQQKTCNERLTLLHAALSALGASNLIAGKVYYPVDVTVPVRSTSFWYYNTNKKKDNYGWNKVSWYQYYCKKSGETNWYPEGLGPMIYIDYSEIPRDYFAPNVDEIPSMNRYSSWYINYYKNYAEKNDLPYFNRDSDIYVPTNWRTELFLMGLRAEENGTDPGPYYQELKLNWPTVFDFKNNKLLPTSIACIDYFVGNTGVMLDSNVYSFSSLNSKETAKISFSDNNDSSVTAKFKAGDEAAIKNFLWNYENDHYYYFFDMIDSSSSTWGEYSVKNIGRRTNVNVSNSVNCVFAPEIPNYAFVNVSNLTLDKRKEKLAELQDVAEDIIQVTDYLYKDFATGGFKQSAYDQIRYDLQQHTSYQNTVSITAIPCFYLEPNVRVELNDHSTNTFGDYLVKSISIPLGAGSNMSVSMSKVMERI